MTEEQLFEKLLPAVSPHGKTAVISDEELREYLRVCFHSCDLFNNGRCSKHKGCDAESTWHAILVRGRCDRFHGLVEDWTNDTAVCVVAYNRPKALQRTLGSIRHWFAQAQVLVGDNSSGEQNLLGDWGGEERETYIRLPKDFGLSASRNYLVDEAARRGFRYVLFCDDDFLFTIDSNIQELAGLLQQGRCDVATGHMERVGRPICAGKFTRENGQFIHKLWQHRRLGPELMDFGGTLMLASVKTLQHCRFDDRCKVGEHFDFYQRAHAQGLRTLVVPRVKVLDGGEDDGRESTEYMAARNRGRDMFRQAATRWAPLMGQVVFKPPGDGEGIAIPLVPLPVVEPLISADEACPWPCHADIFEKAPRDARTLLRKCLRVYHLGGISDDTEQARGLCNTPGIEAFMARDGSFFGCVAGHPWMGEWLRMMPAAWDGTAESIGVRLAMAAMEPWKHGAADVKIV